MSRDQQVLDFKRRRELASILGGWDTAYIHRPIHVVERVDGRPVVVERREHIDLIFNRITGDRKLRTSVTDKDGFDRLAAKAKRFDMPCVLHRGQIGFVLDREHKVTGFFGGTRAGKTQALAERAIDSICLHGGPGDPFAWIAPSMKQTRIGVEKLIRLLPAELVHAFPPTMTTTDQTLYLADGSRVVFYYASKEKADNLKGFAWIEAWADELCSIRYEENYTVMLSRLADHGGQMCFSTTFVPGSWALTRVHEPGFRRDEIPEGIDPPIVYDHITRLDNPYIDSATTEEEVRAAGGWDVPSVRREVKGECVADGEAMWPEFVRSRHVIEGDARECEGWGYVNITSTVFGAWFRNTDPTTIRNVGFMDMNYFPQTCLVCQVGVKKEIDQTDPENWVLFVLDEIQKKVGNDFEFARFIAGFGGLTAAKVRGLRPDYFRGMPIIVDATSAQPLNVPREDDKYRSARWEALSEMGFDVAPPLYTDNNSPANPRRKDRVTRLKRILMDGRIRIHGTRCSHGPYSLIKGLEGQVRGPDGLPDKVSGNRSDRISSSTDALGYGTWRAFDKLFTVPIVVRY